MPEEFKSELHHVHDKITRVEVSVARVEATTDDSNRRLTKIEEKLEHSAANFRQAMIQIERVSTEMRNHSLRITALEEGKADRDDVADLKKKIEGTETMIKGALGKVLMTAGAMVVAYIASKLGISIPGLH